MGMSGGAEDMRRVMAEADCLHDQHAVDAALDRMAEALRARLEGSNPLVLCVMSGALIPAGHLLTRLHFPLELDYCHATRYAGTTSGGELRWKREPSIPLAGRTVLVLDDIFDEGLTLAAILEYCRAQGADEVLSAVLVNKIHDRKVDLVPDVVGLEIPDRYVFGFGMDYRGYLRNMPGIYAVKGL